MSNPVASWAVGLVTSLVFGARIGWIWAKPRDRDPDYRRSFNHENTNQLKHQLLAVYAAGYWCGEQLHRLNDDVTALLTLMVPRPKLLAPAVHPLFEIAADLDRLTCKELRAITNAPRKAVKAQLVAFAARLM